MSQGSKKSIFAGQPSLRPFVDREKIGTYGSKHIEEHRWQFLAEGRCRRRKHPQGKRETPPTHVEGKLASTDTRRSEEQSDERESHMIIAMRNPTIYSVSPAYVIFVGKLCVSRNTVRATLPSCIMPKPPCPSGPSGRNTLTITARGGILYIVRRWKYMTGTHMARGTPVPQRM